MTSKATVLLFLRRLCPCRAEATLAEAISAACQQQRLGSHIAAHQGRRKKKAAMDPVMRLEEDLLRASHGIEAELYQDL